MPRIRTVSNARKTHRCSYCQKTIAVGASYYWWKHKLRRGGLVKKRCKVCGYPKRWLLTLSPFYSTLWQTEDAFDPATADDLAAAVEAFTDDLEALLEECQYSLEAMPEQLQESSESGMMLQDRIDSLEAWIAILQSMDVEIPEHLQTLDQEEAAELEEDLEDWLQDRREEAMGEGDF